MAKNPPGRRTRIINIEQELDDWLKQCAAAEDRTITAELNRILRSAKQADQRAAG